MPQGGDVRNHSEKYQLYWLIICAAMIVAMMSIGAITRLTESGLSITEWKPISGAVPPMGQEAWAAEFAKYQKTPEFAAKHAWMELDDFKKIYFWEWLHRLWGRLIGVVFAVPMIWFWARGWIGRAERKRYLLLLALGAGQGALGWFMVKSGLADRPDVSHFRLAAHFGMAVLIYALIIWLVIGLVLKRTEFAGVSLKPPPLTLKLHAIASLLSVFITMIWGAMVAGLDAGMVYNEFPMMGGHFYPPELGHAPFLSDPANVQFTHRVLAMVTAVVVLGLAFRSLQWGRRNAGEEPKLQFLAVLLCIVVMMQLGLGVATLITQVALPLAVLHQLGGLALFTSVLMLSFKVLLPAAR